MKSFIFFFLLCTAYQSTSSEEPVTFTREYTWNTYDEFLHYGWYESVNNGTTVTYKTPSELDSRLQRLDNNFIDQVWGWKPPRPNTVHLVRYAIDLSQKPEYCGIVNATLTIKYYLERSYSTHQSHVYPSCTSRNSNYCDLPHPELGTWALQTYPIVLSRSLNPFINIHLQGNGLVLFDQVRLTYTVTQDPVKCPYSCTHDCDYRAIDCHNYYTCIDRRYKEIRSCDKRIGLAFNPITKSCDVMQNVEGCEPTRPNECPCGFLPHERNCSLYYYCENICRPQECEVRQCPNGLLWSMDVSGDGSGDQQCTLPSIAICFNERNSTALPNDHSQL